MKIQYCATATESKNLAEHYIWCMCFCQQTGYSCQPIHQLMKKNLKSFQRLSWSQSNRHIASFHVLETVDHKRMAMKQQKWSLTSIFSSKNARISLFYLDNLACLVLHQRREAKEWCA